MQPVEQAKPQEQPKAAEEVKHVDINLAEFVSVCIYLSEECGKIIREVGDSGDLKKVDKSDLSPTTIADLKVQKTIEVCLKGLYPTLNVQGEESKESIENIEPACKSDAITAEIKQFISKEWLNENHNKRQDFLKKIQATYQKGEVSLDMFESFNTKDAVVWIDPLDGTSDFVKGNLPACTVLIGLSVNQQSRFGIVHNPFSFQDQQKSLTYFGSAEHGSWVLNYDKNSSLKDNLARKADYLEPFDHQQEPKPDYEIKVAASLQHFSENMQTIINTIKPVETVRLGGAGNKCNNLSVGTVDAYIHPSPGLKYWDLCAPESIVKGMGGYATDLTQNRIVYDLDASPKLKGLILAKNPPMYNEITRRWGSGLKTILSTVKL